MNGKVVRRIKKAVANLPVLSEKITVTEWVLGINIPKETLEANPGKFKPNLKYEMKVSQTKPIDHIDRAKKIFLKSGNAGVAAYVKEMELAGARVKKEQQKASTTPGAIEKQFRDRSII